MKTAERELAREFRRVEGASLKEIARKLNVARSSVSLWVRDIELTPEQHLALRERNPIYNAQLRGSTANAELGRAANLAQPELLQYLGAAFVRA